jgi:hypothetical protein
MRFFLQCLFLTLLVFTLGACTNRKKELQPKIFNNQNEDNVPDTPDNQNQNEAVLADTFFFGCAYLDANENNVLDETDPKIPDVTFAITLAGGGGFSDRPSKDGCGMIIIPGGLKETNWPVTARMQPPEDANLELVGPAETLLEYPETHADFLFSQR